MTAEPSDGSTADSSASAMPPDTPTVALLKTVMTRIRRDPGLAAPFAVAGLLVAFADRLRKVDPLPAATPDSFERTISVQYSVVPRGTARTVREVGAVLDLRTPYLVGAVALEGLVVLAVGIAGWVTITRALGTDRRLESLSRYLGSLVAIGFLPRLLGSPPLDIASLPLGALAIVVAAVVAVHLFLLPGFLAAGARFTVALRRSVVAPRGSRWPLLWLIVLFGLASWGLARVPFIGGFLSTAVVAPAHAVSIAVLIDGRGSPLDGVDGD